MRIVLKVAFFLSMIASSGIAHAQQPISGAEAMKMFGLDLETVEIRPVAIGSGLHALFGAGGNIVASVGVQGVLIVDDQFPVMVPRIEAAIRQLGGGEIDFVINTHWHFDHADGNPALAENGSWIVAHKNSRQMLTGDHLINLVGMVVAQPAYQAAGLPVITFDDRMQFHFNGEKIDLLHFGPAHTTGDAAVLFRGHNAVHMGDVFVTGTYPFIDADNGGDLDGIIRFSEAVLKEINVETVVIPGHGQIAGYTELAAYISMLKTIRERIASLIEQGATLAEVGAANPTAEWDSERGSPARLLDRAYKSLSRARD